MDDLLDGRYLMRERLGAGTFGEVQRAEHRVLGVTMRHVAVKLFRTAPDAGAPDSRDTVERFLAEAVLAMGTVDRCPDHTVRDRFVACHDAAAGERPYLVMELASGDLTALLDRAQLPIGVTRGYLRQLCQGMEFLHGQGIVHLDLKPGNVLVSTAGTLKIGDLGCAARVEATVRRPVAGGTLAYQPPEVLALAESGPAADVYSLGLIAHQMLTGRLPDQERLHALSSGPPDVPGLIRLKMRPVPPPGPFHPGLEGHPLEAVLLRALSPLSTDRYPDAGAMLRAVEASADGSGAAGPPPPGPERVRELMGHIALALDRSDLDLAARLSDEAAALNRGLGDGVDDLCPVLVRVALRRSDRTLAQRHASEGLRRHRCRATYCAMAAAFAGTDVGRGFDRLCREPG